MRGLKQDRIGEEISVETREEERWFWSGSYFSISDREYDRGERPIERSSERDYGFCGHCVGAHRIRVFRSPDWSLTGFSSLHLLQTQTPTLQEPVTRQLFELDHDDLFDLLPEIPLWIKNPDYERVDWFNRFIYDMWPYIDKAVCGIIRSTTKPIFAEYIGKFQIESIEFESLTLGSLPPTIHGMKVYETNEKEIVFEPAVRWAGNPNITVTVRILFMQITVQLLDLQVFAAPRVTLKPLVPTFPCFSNIVVSLMEKPHVDFGLKILGGDIMAIPGLYRFVQEISDSNIFYPPYFSYFLVTRATKKPVGILHVKVIRAFKLLKMDLLGTSDPYVKLSLSGERLPSKKTSVKMKNLNPEWNEEFKLIVKDPESQFLQLRVFDWEKVGSHDKLGMQIVPLNLLSPNVTQSFTLDLVKSMDPKHNQKKKPRGKIVVDLTFNPFKEDNDKLGEHSGSLVRKESVVGRAFEDISAGGAGVLLVAIQGAEDVEGKKHNNPYASVLFKGEKKKTKVLRKTRDPCWNEDFQYMLEEAPVNDKILIEVLSKRSLVGFRSTICRPNSEGTFDFSQSKMEPPTFAEPLLPWMSSPPPARRNGLISSLLQRLSCCGRFNCCCCCRPLFEEEFPPP
ncbi:hypothetical protein Syun_016264 [Stephania yunnanensis]|uniref:Uncharacterized protein n=1 Tax=Stephania yunnanensis TaxID=152371 RepID=A0AAP0J4H7_9MAGN